MKRSLLIAAAVLVLLGLGLSLLTVYNPDNKIKNIEDYQHVMESDADSSIGSATLPEDYVLDESFVTHLPLVVIDLQGNRIPNTHQFTEDGYGREYTEEGLLNPDPYVSMTIQIIDNDNHENHLTDAPQLTNNGKIKYRGMASRSFEKKQYGIKLMNGDEELEETVLGMEADEDWVLSNSMIDLSGMRNYLAMNIGRQLFPFTSEVRFCEVVFKDGDTYKYQGLYLMMEKVKKSEGRVNITDFDESASSLSYIVCRDRYDTTQYTLSTWASDSQICKSYFTMVYPKADVVSDEAMKRIEAEISKIEYALYSDDPDEFLKYRDYIDIDSFVDYYVFNEYFLSYDPGLNSTYYYKTKDGKLAMGPLWDYDNSIDNYNAIMAGVYYDAFSNQPWFERLVMDEYFQDLVVARYKELRKTYLNNEYIDKFIDETYAYLGNASARDYERWNEAYREKQHFNETENVEGIFIERDSETVEEELQKMKDLLRIHSIWLDEALEYELDKKTNKEFSKVGEFDTSAIAVVGVLAFGAMIIILLRFVKGEYR